MASPPPSSPSADQQNLHQGKGKAVVPPTGSALFLSFHGKPFDISYITRPLTLTGDSSVRHCVYIITTNLRNHHDSDIDHFGTLSDLFVKQNGYQALISSAGFIRKICERLQPRADTPVVVRTAVYMCRENGWEHIPTLGDQIRKYRQIYANNKDNWFIAWYFHFPEGTQIQPLPRPMTQNPSPSVEEGRNDSTNAQRRQSVGSLLQKSSGAASNETVWPSFPWEYKPLPSLPKLPSQPPQPSRPNRVPSHRIETSTKPGLAQKVSSIPRFIARTMSSPIATNPHKIDAPKMLTRLVDSSERPTVLNELADELKSGGLDDLNSLLPVTKAPSQSQWRGCCELLPHLDADQLASDPRARSIGFLNTRLSVAPFQFYSAFQLLQSGGGYLAHDMGLGKTHCVLTAVVLKALIAGSKKRCEEYWAMQGTRSRPEATRHLPKSAKVNPEYNVVCPSQRFGDVQCWCVPGGITRQLGEALVPGASMISVPSDLMSDWVKALLEADFKQSTYNFVVVGGNEVPPHLRQDLSLLMLKFKMSASAPAGTVRVCDSFDLNWHNRTTLEAVGSTIFITSHHNSAMSDTFVYRAKDLGIPVNRGPVFEAGNVYGAAVGLHFIDEAHMPGAWTTTHYPMLMARRHKHISNCDVWFVTGTPFPKERFHEVRGQVALLDPELTTHLERLNQRHQDALYKRSPDKIYKAIRDFQVLFSDNIVLRYLDTTLFFDLPITGVQNVEPLIISRRTPSSIIPIKGAKGASISRKEIQKLMDRLQKLLPTHLPYVERLESKKPVADVLYFVSLFPAAASFIHKHKLAIDDEAIRNDIKALEDRKKVTELALVEKYWERFAKDSPKVQYLREEIDRINNDSRRRPGVIQTRLRKCVILTPTLATAVFLFAWFANNNNLRVRNVHPVFYHRDLSRRDKMQIRDTFKEKTMLPAQKVFTNYFIACAEDAGTGLNLQTANYQILTSPLSRATNQAQAFRRTNRSGQDLPLVHKLLVLEDSPIDRINLVGQARRQFESNPFDVLSNGGMVKLNEHKSPASSDSSQEDLAVTTGTRPIVGAQDSDDEAYGTN